MRYGLLRVVVHPGLGGNLQHVGAPALVLQEVVAQPGVGVLQLGVGDAFAPGIGGQVGDARGDGVRGVGDGRVEVPAFQEEAVLLRMAEDGLGGQ